MYTVVVTLDIKVVVRCMLNGWLHRTLRWSFREIKSTCLMHCMNQTRWNGRGRGTTLYECAGNTLVTTAQANTALLKPVPSQYNACTQLGWEMMASCNWHRALWHRTLLQLKQLPLQSVEKSHEREAHLPSAVQNTHWSATSTLI